MGYIKFDKNKLVNLEYSLHRELLRANRAGSFASTTIIGCNTRKYHGLLITRQPQIDDEYHVFLSTLDVTVVQREKEFHLGIHKYGSVFSPKGHKYISDFETDPIPRLTYRVGGAVLTVERLYAIVDDRMMIRYTLTDAHSPTKLRFKPFLAFRRRHELSKANYDAGTEYAKAPNGIRFNLYKNKGYSDLFFQFSKSPSYSHKPEWYYNISYQMEEERGFEHTEDLFVPGEFETEISKGESIIFSAGLSEVPPAHLNTLYEKEIRTRIPRNSFIHCLENSAQQFIMKKGKTVEIIAGYPWYTAVGRDTFISLPGLLLSQKDKKTFLSVIDDMISEMDGPFFLNVKKGKDRLYNCVDTSLWFFWSLQQYVLHFGRASTVWEKYGGIMKLILNEYRKGARFSIRMLENGLLYTGDENNPLTWMNVYVHGHPYTLRKGLAVEINALWYNAVMFTLTLAGKAGDKEFYDDWSVIAQRIPDAFLQNFIPPGCDYPADYCDNGRFNRAIRPNMVLVASLPFSPVPEEIRKRIIDIIEEKLLTPRGLRTLSPDDPDYKGTCEGNQDERDMAYHQGSVFPWLLGQFADAYLKLNGKSGVSLIRKLLYGFEEVMASEGIGSISELYDGDPPHRARGGISQAWNVAELLRIHYLLAGYETKTLEK